MPRIIFEEVSLKATKRWTDASGKKRQATKKLWQTINPFNTNSDGSERTREQIMVALIAERDEWMAATGDP